MFSENRWKVILLLVASVGAVEPSRALSLVYQKPYKNVMFVPKNLYRRTRARQSRVLFLDEDENHQPFGKGEIDLTQDKSYSQIKFDDQPDYEFTSPEDAEVPKKLNEDLPSGNERFYEPLPRFRPFSNHPHYYQGRFGRTYAPNFGFDPYPVAPFAPSVRNGYYPGWKPRSPRVVFPYASESVNSVQTNSHAGPGGFNDNVVFRDQNFGLNDVGDEQALQDLGTGSGDGFAERGESAI
ncbi:hypothetical protein HF086_016389 [Spodoptera exigua]|uniref:Uncharacterized protein n=1 Tax=Spodoptera exigua TaxID=7107 RepID=A0A922M5N4_SPOEX|nr:hypothetical protein HF086_016389 [Spodoptera exigua]